MLSDLYMLMDSFFTLMYQFVLRPFGCFSLLYLGFILYAYQKKKKKKNYTNLKSKY